MPNHRNLANFYRLQLASIGLRKLLHLFFLQEKIDRMSVQIWPTILILSCILTKSYSQGPDTVYVKEKTTLIRYINSETRVSCPEIVLAEYSRNMLVSVRSLTKQDFISFLQKLPPKHQRAYLILTQQHVYKYAPKDHDKWGK